MASLPRRLDKLEDDLDALPPEADAMTLGEIDGFIAGLLVCPVEIAEDEWLAMLWRDVGDDGTPLDMSAATTLVPDVLDHYRRVSLELRASEDGYMPIYYNNPDDGSVVWQPWAMGLGEAMQMRMDVWAQAMQSEDEAVVAALTGLMAIVGVAHDAAPAAPGSKEAEAIVELVRDAPDLIPVWVETLFDWRLTRRPEPVQAPVRVVKVGRNDPCPCGSGQKHKKCCGAAQPA